MRYEIYHDESKKDAYWHIFLFVPESNKKMLINALAEARKEFNYNGNMHFCKKDFSGGHIFRFAKAWLSIGLSSFQQTKENNLYPYWLCRPTYNKVEFVRKDILGKRKVFPQLPKVKVAIFRQEENHEDMTGNDQLSKIETTFRMGLQGACHYLFDNDNHIEISKIFIDGEEQYPIEHHRELDKNKIITSFDRKARPYCTIAPDCEITGEKLTENEHELLQFSDLFLGTFRAGIVRNSYDMCKNDNEKAKFNLGKPLKSFFSERISRGGKRMSNSRFNKFGTFSSAKIQNNAWEFSTLHDEFMSPPDNQAKLF